MTAPGQQTFASLDPVSGAVIAEHPVRSASEVAAAVAGAQPAARWWAELDFAGRRSHLTAWRRLLARRARELAELISRETGKPLGDAVLEVLVTLDHLDWAARSAADVLGQKRVRPGLLAANQAAYLEYQPLGVVGVIGPWNYPLFTPMGSIAYALAAGNAVVFKPSEYTPGVGVRLAESFAEAVPGPPVLQVLTGPASTGDALCRAAVDKIAFTGSARTGRVVMAACAERLTPVLMECGGKDALIVDDDADLDAAVDAALWGGMSNAGQTCVGVERVLVTNAVYDEFLRRLTVKARTVQAGDAYGPMTMPSQLDVVRRHVGEALDTGAQAVVGGRQSVHDRYVDPVILTDVPAAALAQQQETFGPTLTVTRVRDADEAVELANATGYGLAGAVFGSARAMETARRMRSGMTSINDVIAFVSVPGLPFGGTGESGFGRIHGADGLREFARPKAITRRRFPLPVPLTSFRRPEAATGAMLRLIRWRYGH